MPSRIPWLTSSKTGLSSDQHLEIPRATSRAEVGQPPRQSPLEAPNNPYPQGQPAFQSTTSFESASSPPGSSSAAGATAPPPLEPGYQRDPYEQHFSPPPGGPQQPAPQQQQQQQPQPQPQPQQQQRAVLQKSQPPQKKSFFGRKKSVRRKDPPNLDSPYYQTQQQQQQQLQQRQQQQQQQQQQQDPRAGPPWTQAERTEGKREVVRPPRPQHPFGTYDQDYPVEVYQSQAFFDHPIEPTVNPQQLTEPHEPHYQQEPFPQYSAPPEDELQGEEGPPPPPHFQLYRDSAPDSPVVQDQHPVPPQASQTSFESFPQPPSGPGSRPISRQSHDRPEIGPQGQLDPHQAYPILEEEDQLHQEQNFGSGESPMAPFSGQKNRAAESSKGNSSQPQLIRENSNLHPGLGAGADSSQNAQRTQQLVQEAGETRSRTPPPPRSAAEMTEGEVNQLIRDHREMKQKYNNVKRQYFDKKDQVDSLQNTLAQQRIIQSRTQWDDGEYIGRMARLDGLISQLAFGMRKDWKVIPEWLQPYCNKDALQVAKQEMTAVGRAYISRWLADELFDRFFHPGLDYQISTELKTIQRNIREYSPPPQSGEEEEALNARVVNWRLATIDGLQPSLSSHEAMANKQALLQQLQERLVHDIQSHMHEPGPDGLGGGVHMIVDLAVGILSNLPLESRDVNVFYYPPGYPINSDLMKIETGVIPVLPGSQENTETDQTSAYSTAAESHEAEVPASHNGKIYEEQGKRGFLGSLVGGASGNSSQKRNPSPNRPFSPSARLGNNPSAAGSQNSLPQGGQQTGAAQPNREDRVRMCIFLGAQIRGKLVLVKAPVYKI